jgi:hypothetical protein
MKSPLKTGDCGDDRPRTTDFIESPNERRCTKHSFLEIQVRFSCATMRAGSQPSSTARSVKSMMRTGRSRWQIENETFNTLKNQGYHFEHNYGHRQQHLATVLALLMLLAFLVDQIQQRCGQLFRQVWRGLKTKAKLWDTLRSLFRVLVFDSMAALFRHMASLYRL